VSSKNRVLSSFSPGFPQKKQVLNSFSAEFSQNPVLSHFWQVFSQKPGFELIFGGVF
jgi:hypothetical protein